MVWLIPVGILLGSFLAGFFVQTILLSRLAKLFTRTETQLDDLILESVRKYLILWFLLAGVVFSAHWIPVSPKVLTTFRKVELIIFFVLISSTIAHFLTGFIRVYTTRLPISLPVTSLSENLINVLVYGLGVLLILTNLGISITPILTALGVGSLAVALALQDTLTNLFAGIYIILNRQIRLGDYIKLDSGQSGYVTDIGWRQTKIRELANNSIVIPNSKLSQSILTNYHLPEKEMAVVFSLQVGYESDLSKVEKVTIETARKVLNEVPGGVAGFEPFVRFQSFEESGIKLGVILRVKEFTDQYLVIHELIKRLKETYAQEKIEIPLPQRVLWNRQG